MAAKKKATPKVADEVVNDAVTPQVNTEGEGTPVEDTASAAVVTNTETTETTPEAQVEPAVDGGADNNTPEGANDDTDGTSDPAVTEHETSVGDDGETETSDDTDDEDTSDDVTPTTTETTPVVTEPEKEPEISNGDGGDLAVGDAVMIHSKCKANVTGVALPTFAYKNEYRVKKILNDRVIIACGLLTYAVKASDLIKA